MSYMAGAVGRPWLPSDMLVPTNHPPIDPPFQTYTRDRVHLRSNFMNISHVSRTQPHRSHHRKQRIIPSNKSHQRSSTTVFLTSKKQYHCFSEPPGQLVWHHCQPSTTMLNHVSYNVLNQFSYTILSYWPSRHYLHNWFISQRSKVLQSCPEQPTQTIVQHALMSNRRLQLFDISHFNNRDYNWGE
jgi:hypothetical protein